MYGLLACYVAGRTDLPMKELNAAPFILPTHFQLEPDSEPGLRGPRIDLPPCQIVHRWNKVIST